MTGIASRLQALREELPAGVRLVAVSKYQSVEVIREAYDAGQRVFGESRAQELLAKREVLPDDIEWHFIGHLQPNKVKYIAPFVSLIHAVDSVRLLREIDRQGARCGRVVPCLLQLHVAQEETKYGFAPDECLQMLADEDWRSLRNVRICGVMCMASNTDDEARVRHDFRLAADFFRQARSRFFADDAHFCDCSWGMSGDYRIAIEEGSTMIRPGSCLFGSRL